MPPFRKSHNYGGHLEILEDAGERASGMKENDERRKPFGGSCRRVRSIWKSKMVLRQYPSTSDYLPLMPHFADSKGLQFYSELSGLLTTLRRDVQGFISSRKTERDSLAGQAETQLRLSGVGTTFASPPAKPPPPPSSLDQVFSSLTLKSTPVSPGPPPPPLPASAIPASAAWTPVQRAVYTGQPNFLPPSLTQPYSSPPPPASQSPPFVPPPPPPSQSAHVQPSTRSPFPPTPPVQSPFGVAPPQPQRDPYAGLASLASSNHFPMPPTAPRQASYPLPGQQQGQAYQTLSSPAHTVYTYSGTPPSRQGSTGSVLPPPPPPVSYSQLPPPQTYSVGMRPPYGVSPPPTQQQPYGGYGQYGR